MARAFCEPVRRTSMPSSSFLIGSTLKELTVSTIEMTSGNSRSTAMMAGRSLMRAGGGLVVDQGDGVVAAGGELAARAAGSTGWPHSALRAPGLLAAAEGDIEPLVGEGAVHAVEHLLLHDVAEGAFHHAPGAAGREVDGSLV
jgi:hypothetical protein